MKLTKQQTIQEHRKMWNWIATMLKSERYKAFDYTECGNKYGTAIVFLKRVYMNMIGLKGKIFCDCFCCEYDGNPDVLCSCVCCPVIWCNGKCSNSEYGQLIKLPYTPENLDKAAALALKIANLPERKD